MSFYQAAIGFQGSWEVSDCADEPIRAAMSQATKSLSQFRISRRLCPAATSSDSSHHPRLRAGEVSWSREDPALHQTPDGMIKLSEKDEPHSARQFRHTST